MDPTDPLNLNQYMGALGQVESAGNGGYNAVGPWVNKKDGSKDRAYGFSQVMGNNIPSWTKIATGTSMTPSEFLASPDAQEAVTRHFFGGYLKQYGNPQDAASMWFSGKPLAQGASKSDGYNTGAQYVAKFNRALANGQGMGPSSAMSQAMLPQTSTPDTGSVPPGMPTPAGTPANLINQSFAALNGPGSAGGPRSVVDQDFNTLSANPSASTPTQQVAQGFGAAGNDPTDLVNGDFQTLGASPQTANPALLAALKAKMAGSAIPSAATPTSGNNPLDAQNPGGAVGPGAQPSSPQGPQQPSQMDMMQGMLRNGGMPTGAVGAANSMASGLQGFGAGLMSIYSPSGSAAMMNAQTNARNTQNNQMLMGLKARQELLPVWGETGTDMLGHPQYGWINKQNQTVNGQPMGTGGNSGTDQLAAQLQPLVTAVVNGQALPKNIGFRERTYVLNAAHQQDPTLTDTMLDNRGKFADALANSSPTEAGGQVNSANTIVDHANQALQYIKTLDAAGVFSNRGAALGGVSNAINKQSAILTGNQTVQAAEGALQTNLLGLSMEAGKLQAGKAPQQAELQHDMANMDPAVVGPAAARAAIEAKINMMYGKMGGLAAQRNLGYTSKPTDTADVAHDPLNYGGQIRPMDLFSQPMRQLLRSWGVKRNDTSPTLSTLPAVSSAPTGIPTATKVIGGQTYHQIGNQWFQE